MQTIREVLQKRWDEEFGKEYEQNVQEQKILLMPDGEVLCEVIFSKKLEEWYESDKGKARYSKPECFFCELHDEYHELREVAQWKHFKIYFNLKFVAPCHFLIAPNEHREYPSFEDIIALQGLARESGLVIIGNFRDSGASFPQHVHYQSLLTDFCVTKKKKIGLGKVNDICIERLNYPTAIYRLSPRLDRKEAPGFRISQDREDIARIICRAKKPYNLLFDSQNTFVTPRKKSVPYNTNGFKFATAEVFGKVYCRSRSFYDSLDTTLMLDALKDVCTETQSVESEPFDPFEESLWDFFC